MVTPAWASAGQGNVCSCAENVMALNMLQISVPKSSTGLVKIWWTEQSIKDGMYFPVKFHPREILFEHSHATSMQTIAHEGLRIGWHQEFCFRHVSDAMEAPQRAAIRNLFHCSFKQKSCMLINIETVGLGFASSVPKESYNEHVSLKISFQLQTIILPGTFMSHREHPFN